ncbi:hypothetical protein [Shewanella halifaxensis]|uniref:hypothetical protein n=1 Tax=Shewanella halifaxensis TaxID=271098 RepID=UPI000D59FC91|nr:hypothetical protein [Shewanella halifaxensis]
MTHLNTVAQSVPAANTPAFDLSNPQHLAMRKLMADIYSRHLLALENGVLVTAVRYRGAMYGLMRCAMQVTKDYGMAWLCIEMINSLEAFEELYEIQARAAA